MESSTEITPPMTPSSKRRRKRDSLSVAAIWRRLPTTWKTITVIAFIFAAGWGGKAFFDGYVQKDDIGEEHKALRAVDASLQSQINVLREAQVVTTESVKAIKDASKETREDVRKLLIYLLENPPGE